jgi:hypothetical protein
MPPTPPIDGGCGGITGRATGGVITGGNVGGGVTGGNCGGCGGITGGGVTGGIICGRDLSSNLCIDKKSSLGFSRGNLSNGSGSLSGKGKTGCGGTKGVAIGLGAIGSKFSNNPLFLNILFKNAIFNSSFPDNLQKTSSTYRCF